jgi:hypothetical protein
MSRCSWTIPAGRTLTECGPLPPTPAADGTEARRWDAAPGRVLLERHRARMEAADQVYQELPRRTVPSRGQTPFRGGDVAHRPAVLNQRNLARAAGEGKQTAIIKNNAPKADVYRTHRTLLRRPSANDRDKSRAGVRTSVAVGGHHVMVCISALNVDVGQRIIESEVGTTWPRRIYVAHSFRLEGRSRSRRLSWPTSASSAKTVRSPGTGVFGRWIAQLLA